MFEPAYSYEMKVKKVARIDNRRKSGATVAVACEEERISTASYYSWKRELFVAENEEPKAETESGNSGKDYEARIKILKGEILGLKKTLKEARETIDDLEAMIADIAIEKFNPMRFNVNKMVAGTLLDHWKNSVEFEPEEEEVDDHDDE